MTKPKPPSDLSDEDKRMWEHVSKSVKPLKPYRQVVPALSQFQRTPNRVNQQNTMLWNLKIKSVGDLLYSSPRRLKRPSVDAKIDLHGMGQEEAKAALFRFIERSFQKGFKTLLVITGKGLKTLTTEGRSGAIKYNFPFWLKDPQVYPFIHFYAPAHARDGGEGAFYVVLKKKMLLK